MYNRNTFVILSIFGVIGMSFKVYVSGDYEFFCFIDGMKENKIKLEFSQSLLDLLYLDIWGYESCFKDAESLEQNLDMLSKAHIYLELLKFIDLKSLPKKKITHIPSNIATMQDQIKDLIANVLDAMSIKKPVQEKMVKYYTKPHSSLERFQFHSQSTNFELIDSTTFTEVLYPNDIYDIIDFLLRECIKREQSFKVCKSCGRYFVVTGHANSEYCNRLFKDTGKTCKEIGAVKVYQTKVNDNPAIKAYNKAYKTHFARVKYKRMTKEEFMAWAEIARDFRDKVLAGKMDLAEYMDWLKI